MFAEDVLAILGAGVGIRAGNGVGWAEPSGLPSAASS